MAECPFSHRVKSSESYLRFLTGHLDRQDVLGRYLQQFALVLWLLLHTARGMLDIDAIQLVGYETGISPCLRVTHLIGLGQHLAVFSQALAVN